MRKSRIILAIILLILLVGIGIVLPYIWKQNRQEPVPPAKTQQEQPSLEHTDTPQLTFTDFEQMEQFLPKDVISDLKKLIPSMRKRVIPIFRKSLPKKLNPARKAENRIQGRCSRESARKPKT